MALRNQPYIPLYVQDYLSDEKLSCCSLSSQGVYIRILCVFHKSETYGGILFKQIPKQTFSSMQYFAYILSRQIGCSVDEISEAVDELVFFEVLKIKKIDGVDYLYQKRMESDYLLSIKRSEIAKKGGGNPKLAKTNKKQDAKVLFKQSLKQNTEYENEIENEYENVIKIEKQKTKKSKIEILSKYDEELKMLVEIFNQVTNSRVTAIEPIVKNYEYWRKIYDPATIEEAIRKIPTNDFWKNKMTLTTLFRRKNPQGEDVDYISSLNNAKSEKNSQKNEVFGAAASYLSKLER